MRTLILINGAPAHRPFYSRVGDELVRQGHEVIYAVDSHFTDVMYPDAPLRGPVHYFSEYFRSRRGVATIPKELEDANLWLAMFPDFERLNHPSGARWSSAWRTTKGYYHDLVAALASFYWDLFETYRFDRVVYEVVSNAFAYVAYLVAKKRGVVFVGLNDSRIPGRLDVSTSLYQGDPRLEETYCDLRSGRRTLRDDVRMKVDEYLRKFVETPPPYMVAWSLIDASPVSRYVRREALVRVARALKYRLTQPEDHEHAFQVPDAVRVYPGFFAWEVERFLRVRKLKREFYRQPDLSRRFFVYPVQYHPESSTSVSAPYYIDELTMVRNLAMSLPTDAYLYVKDHQHVAAGRQPTSFYEEVRRTPNVTLIDPAFPAKTLVAHSAGVIAVTSTMGYEAVVLGKPVVVFGKAFYDFHPLCLRITSFADTFDAVQRTITMHATKEDIFDFVAAYYLCTYPGNYNLPVTWKDPELVSTVSSIIESPPAVSTAVQTPASLDALLR